MANKGNNHEVGEQVMIRVKLSSIFSGSIGLAEILGEFFWEEMEFTESINRISPLIGKTTQWKQPKVEMTVAQDIIASSKMFSWKVLLVAGAWAECSQNRISDQKRKWFLISETPDFRVN